MLCIAHRGASGYAPESTHAAFERAIAMGADATETDVQLTADGHLVLFHDDLVDRTSDGRGALADYTLAELRKLDLGRWYGEAFAGERILTVEEALDAYAARIPFALEIKDPRAAIPLATLLAARGIRDGITIRSFSWGALLDAQAIHPAIPYGFLIRTLEEDVIERSVRRGFQEIYPHIDRLTVRRVALAHERGLRVFAWGLSRRDLVERLFETGADGASCNWPDWIIDMRTT
ncbi:MAG: glycerophosphodiester phosphodiesterase family protein [Chloroflexia bacterium]